MDDCYVYDMSYDMDVIYIAEDIDSELGLSVDAENEGELIDNSSEDADVSDLDTAGTVEYSELYDAVVSEVYLSGVIAFGVFLLCGLLIGKIFWERFR